MISSRNSDDFELIYLEFCAIQVLKKLLKIKPYNLLTIKFKLFLSVYVIDRTM